MLDDLGNVFKLNQLILDYFLRHQHRERNSWGRSRFTFIFSMKESLLYLHMHILRKIISEFHDVSEFQHKKVILNLYFSWSSRPTVSSFSLYIYEIHLQRNVKFTITRYFEMCVPIIFLNPFMTEAVII